MRRIRLDDDGCSLNFDHIVTVERTKDRVVAYLVSGSNVYLQGVYPVAYDLFQLGKDIWVNPEYVSMVGVGYNKDEAFKDIMASVTRPDDYYKQIQVETVLGRDRAVFADLYELDELDYLAGRLMDGETND